MNASATAPARAVPDSVDALQKAVVCRGVTKEFGDGDSKTLALRGVDMDVFAGQMTLLVGQSAAARPPSSRSSRDYSTRRRAIFPCWGRISAN
jgi:putative ABC transport system ATP-binding protein